MRIQRRFNYTDRKRIDHFQVDIALIDQNGKPQAFQADLDLESLKLPSEAKIYIEAYNKTSRQRFDCGTIGNFMLPSDTTLWDVDNEGSTLFRVKIVDEQDEARKIIASASRIRASNADEDTDRDSLLIAKKINLGSLPWKLSLSDDVKPELYLNNQIPGVLDQIQQNVIFQGLMFPAIIKEIYQYIFVYDQGGPGEGSWQQQWVDFGCKLTGLDSPDFNNLEPYIYNEWISDVVDAFSSKYTLAKKMEKYYLEDKS